MQEVKGRLSSEAVAAAIWNGRWKNQMWRVAHNGCCRPCCKNTSPLFWSLKFLTSEGLVEALKNIEILHPAGKYSVAFSYTSLNVIFVSWYWNFTRGSNKIQRVISWASSCLFSWNWWDGNTGSSGRDSIASSSEINHVVRELAAYFEAPPKDPALDSWFHSILNSFNCFVK